MRSRTWKLVTILFAFCVAWSDALAQINSKVMLDTEIRHTEAIAAGPLAQNGAAWLKLALLYQDAARYGDAAHAFEKAVRLLKAKDRDLYAEALDHMGTMYVERGKFGKAEPLEKKALEIREDAKDEVAIGTSYMHLALLAYGRHDLTAADADAGMAVSLLVPKRPRDRSAEATPEEKMSALVDLSLIQCARGDCAGAIPELNRALGIAHGNYAANSVPVGFLDFLLGHTYWKSGDSRQAPALMKRGIDEMEQELGWGHPTFIAALKQYRSVLAQTGSNAEAEQVGRQIAQLEATTGSGGRLEESGLPGINTLR